ncbi:MAG TPA: helix-turn-helix transcriptional regulator [Thermoanaerobaculia bacterium]|jgi:DNA-binding CsgD family transcriptional regulator
MRKTSPAVVVEPFGEGISSLAERLMRRALDDDAHDGNVLLDLERDGVRCVIVRAPSDRPAPAPPPTRPHSDGLSPREREIARMIADGYPNKTIAAVLEISSWTVNTYLRRMFAKLGVTSRAAMTAKLLRKNENARDETPRA